MRPAFRNVGYNLAGQVLPMASAIIALPIIARLAGTDRLGFLGLAWSLIGYFALLDLGLSRIVTRRVAMADLQGTLLDERRVVRRLSARLFLATAAISAVLAFTVDARWIVGATASGALVAEAQAALPILFLTIPATVVTGLLRGALEGMQRFAKANLLRTVFGTLSFAAPLAVLPIGVDLVTLTVSIAAVRALSLVAHAAWALRALDLHANQQSPSVSTPMPRPRFAAMVKEGGWLTVSNVVGPLMVTFDRFAVARIVSLTAASYYFVPQEVALRLLVLPGAVATTIFPMLARLGEASIDRHRISRDALLAIAATSLPACTLLAALALPLLSVWMGAEFARSAGPVAAILAVGLFGNCCAQAPFAWIQAAGRSDVTGRLHLLQLPFYALVLVTLTMRFGVVGTALAWSIRAVADLALLLIASSRLFPAVELGDVLRPIAIGMTSLVALAGVVFLPDGWPKTSLMIGLPALGLALSASMAIRLRTNIRR